MAPGGVARSSRALRSSWMRRLRSNNRLTVVRDVFPRISAQCGLSVARVVAGRSSAGSPGDNLATARHELRASCPVSGGARQSTSGRPSWLSGINSTIGVPFPPPRTAGRWETIHMATRMLYRLRATGKKPGGGVLTGNRIEEFRF